MRKIRSIPTTSDRNVHTYAHARAVLRDHQLQPFQQLQPQTFRWPSSYPTEYPCAPITFGSPYGPPVRNFDDLLAFHYLQTHHPESLRLRTSEVLSRVSDEELEEIERKREATRKFEEKYSSYTSSFERRANIKVAPFISSDARSTPVETLVEPQTKKKPTRRGKGARQRQAEKYLKRVIAQKELAALENQEEIVADSTEEFSVDFVEEHLPTVVPNTYSYVECEYPPLQYATETIIVPLVASLSIIEVEKDEQSNEPVTPSLVTRDDTVGLPVVYVCSKLLARVCNCSLVVSLCAGIVVPSLGSADRFLPVLWNFKKRRRKCVMSAIFDLFN